MIWIIHLVFCAIMTGIIWLVQIVVYPQMLSVNFSNFRPYEKAHMDRIGKVVGPIMIIELITGIWIWIDGNIPEGYELEYYITLILGIIIGLSTALIQAPLHFQLSKEGKDYDKINRLITTNWIRTFSWSGRIIILSWITYRVLQM